MVTGFVSARRGALNAGSRFASEISMRQSFTNAAERTRSVVWSDWSSAAGLLAVPVAAATTVSLAIARLTGGASAICCGHAAVSRAAGVGANDGRLLQFVAPGLFDFAARDDLVTPVKQLSSTGTNGLLPIWF